MKPTIDNASVSPASDSVETGENYTFTCEGNYSLIGNATVECNDDGTLSMAPACIGLYLFVVYQFVPNNSRQQTLKKLIPTDYIYNTYLININSLYKI